MFIPSQYTPYFLLFPYFSEAGNCFWKSITLLFFPTVLVLFRWSYCVILEYVDYFEAIFELNPALPQDAKIVSKFLPNTISPNTPSIGPLPYTKSFIFNFGNDIWAWYRHTNHKAHQNFTHLFIPPRSH